MAIAGKFIFSLFIGILIGIIIEKTANCLALQHQEEQKDNYYNYSNGEYVDISRIDEENDRLIEYY